MSVGSPEQQTTVRKAIETGGREHIDEVTQAIKSTDAIEYTALKAREEADYAIAQLGCIPDSRYRDALIGLAEFSINRSY